LTPKELDVKGNSRGPPPVVRCFARDGRSLV
jgi:hypothetical protein